MSSLDGTNPYLPECHAGNQSGLLGLWSNPANNFQMIVGDASGVGIRANPGVALASWQRGEVQFNAPPGSGIWSANIRGDIFDTSGDIQCELSYDRTPDSRIPYEYQDGPHGNGSGVARFGSEKRLWAAHPRGGDDPAAWATFPIPGGYAGVPNHSSNPARAFHGYFITNIADPNASSVPVSDLAGHIRLSMRSTKNITANSNHRCEINGAASIAIHDAEPPKIGTGTFPNSMWNRNEWSYNDLGMAPYGWHRPSTVASAALSAPLRSFLFTDGQSGVRSVSLRVGTSPGSGSYRPSGTTPIFPCDGLNDDGTAVDVDQDRLRIHNSSSLRYGPCPRSQGLGLTSTQPLFSVGTLANQTDDDAGRHAVTAKVTDFAHRSHELTPQPTNPLSPVSSNQGWYFVDDAAPTCTSLQVKGAQYAATVALTAKDPGADGTAGSWSITTASGAQRTEAFPLGSGLANVAVYVNGQQSWSGYSSTGAQLSQTLSNINLNTNATIVDKRRIATIVVSLQDRTETPWRTNPSNNPSPVPDTVSLAGSDHHTVPYGPLNMSASNNACAVKIDLGPEEIAAPSCNTTLAPLGTRPSQPNPARAEAIHFVDDDDDGKGFVRVYVSDSDFVREPAGGTGVRYVSLNIGSSPTLTRYLTNAERDQGYVDFLNIDVAAIAGLPDGTSFNESVSRPWPDLLMVASFADRASEVGLTPPRADRTNSCSRSFPWIVDPPSGRPECVQTSILGTEEPRPQVGASSIHVIDPDNDGVANVRVDFRDAHSGVGTVRLTVNGNVVATKTVAGWGPGAGSVTFEDVDLLAGIVPEEGVMTSFYSRPAAIQLDALLTDRTVIVPPDQLADHQVTCNRTIDLYLDETQPSCIDKPGDAEHSRPIHLRDEDDGTDFDSYGTIRVYLDDAGSRNADGTLTDPPTGAGVKVVRISVNGESVDPTDPKKTRTLDDDDRRRGYVDFPGLDFFENVQLDDEGNPPITIDGDPNVYFVGPVTVRVRAELDDRTVLMEPQHIDEHTNECDIEETFEQPDETLEIDAVRGADNIVGVWPAVQGPDAGNVRGYIWRCQRTTPLTVIVAPTRFEADDADRLETLGSGHENEGNAIAPGTYVNTPHCAPGQEYGTNREIDLFARAETNRVLSDERKAWETVDLAPQGGVAGTAEMIAGHNWLGYLWMSENGIRRDFGTLRDALPIRLIDRDGRDDLFAPSDPDERVLLTELTRATSPLTPAGDPARVVVGIKDKLPRVESVVEQRAYVVIQLAKNPDDILYRLVEGEPAGSPEDHATRPLDAADADTCRRGDPTSEAAIGTYWVLRCDLIPDWMVDYANASTSDVPLDFAQAENVGLRGSTWYTLELPVHPREYETEEELLRDRSTHTPDAFPLAGGEAAPAEAVHNTAKPTPDRFGYGLNVAVRDRRQASDDRYRVNSPANALPDRPMPNVWDTLFSPSAGADLVIDRVIPTVLGDLDQTLDQIRVPAHVAVSDPRPSSATDPTSRNASGLRSVAIELFQTDDQHDAAPVNELTDTLLDGGELDSMTQCIGAFPLPENSTGPDRDSSSICSTQLLAPTEPTANGTRLRIGTYKVRSIVTDMATNWSQHTRLMIIPGAVDLTAVRGAGGVVGWWPAIRGGDHFAYTCTVDGYTSPERIVTQPDSSGFWRTDLCEADPGERVDIEVVSINDVGLRGPDTDSAFENVDQRPAITLRTSTHPARLPQLTSEGWWESSFNGRSFRPADDVEGMIDEKTPYTVVDITDPDHNLLEQIAPDPHMLDLAERPDCTPCANDYPRAVVTLRPEIGTTPTADHRDLPEAAHVLIQLSADPQQQLVRIWDGPRDASAWDRTLDANDSDTCRPGEADRVIHSQPSGMWTLDCERMVFTDLLETLADDSEVTAGVRALLPVSPRDQGEGATPRFPTPDQPYRVQATVKDQRQAADHRFLTNEYLVNTQQDVPDAGPIVADDDLEQHKWLWVDRVLPRLEDDQITQFGNDWGPHQHRVRIEASDPNDATTDPNRIRQSGLLRAHIRGGLIDPAGNVVGETVNANMSCTPPATLAYTAASACTIDTNNLPLTGTYRYTITLTDFVGNTSQTTIEQFYVAPPKPPVLNSESGARGQGMHWSPVLDATHYQWTCWNITKNTAPIPMRTVVTPTPSGVLRTDVCGADSGDRVGFSVRAFGLGGYSLPAETWVYVDRRPTIHEGADPDGFSTDGTTVRYDRANGDSYASGSTLRDLYIRVQDDDPELDEPFDPSPHWNGIAERPSPSEMADAIANAPARSVIAVRPPSNRPIDTGVFIIVQHGDAASRAVKILDTSFTGELATTPILDDDYLTDASVCRPNQNKVLETAYWTIDCNALTSTTSTNGVSSTALSKLPLRPRAVTPDQRYTVTGWVRDNRQQIDFRYLAQGAGSTFDEPYAEASATPLGSIVLDRVLPQGTVAVPATSGGPTTLRVNAAFDVTPSAATTPTQFDPTGLAAVTAQVADPAGAPLLAQTQMSCTPQLPRAASLPTDCEITVTPTISGTHTATFRLTDVAGNVREYTTTFEFSTVPPPAAPASLLTSMGARGVGAYWNPVPGATGYRWTCKLRSTGAAILQDQVAVFSGYQSFWRTALCPAAPGEIVDFQVWSTGPGGTSTTFATTFREVDSHPRIEATNDPDGGLVRYDTANGTKYANNTYDREIRFSFKDAGIEYPTGASQVFDGIAERPMSMSTADQTSRSVIAIHPPSNRMSDATSAYVIVQYNTTQTGHHRRFALVDSSFNGDLATVSLMSTTPPPGMKVCNPTFPPAMPLEIDHWTLDCTKIAYTPIGSNQVDVSLPIRPKAGTPEQTYTVTGWGRDFRQHLDFRYLSTDASVTPVWDQPYANAQKVDLGSIVVDRIAPIGVPNVPSTATGSITLKIDTAQDVDPTNYDGSGLASATVSVRRASGPVVLVSTTMNCTPNPRIAAGVLTNCSYTYTPPSTDSYVAVLRLTDTAGNWTSEERPFSFAVVPPPAAPAGLAFVRGATGGAATWAANPAVSSYAWTCHNVASGVLISSGSGTASATANRQRSEPCIAPPGTQLRFSVTAQGPGGTSAPATTTGTVDQRPNIAWDAGASSSVIYSSASATQDLKIHVTDPDQDYTNSGTGGGEFAGHPIRDNPAPIDPYARSVIRLTPPAGLGRPTSSSAYIMVQHVSPANRGGVAIFDSTYTGNLATFAFSLGDYASNPRICQGGQSKSISAGQWTIDCSLITESWPNVGEIKMSIPVRPIASTPEQAYTVSGWTRDRRQALDVRYLSSDMTGAADQPYYITPPGSQAPAVMNALGSLTVDRISPDGTPSATNVAGGNVRIAVDPARDIKPTSPATFDASGLAFVTASVTNPDTSSLTTDAALACAPTLPTTQDDPASCFLDVTPTQAGEHEYSVRLIDMAGNERILSGTFTPQTNAPVAPLFAPNVSVLRATTGVVAKWAPLADATGYRWKCENVTRNTSEQGTATQSVGGVVRTPACTGAGANPAGTTVRVTVTPFNEAGDGPASTPASATVDVRPTMTLNTASGFNPDAGYAWTYSKSGRVHSNGTRNREIFVRAVDADGDLTAAPVIDADLNGGATGAPVDRARFIARISPPTSSPAETTAHVIVQLGPDDQSRLVRLVEGATAPQADSVALNGADADTCTPGQTGKTLVGQYWQLNCERILLATPSATPTAVDMRLPLFPRIAANGTQLLPDQTYTFSGYVRDVRQPADRNSLTHSSATSSTDYATVAAQVLSVQLFADRLDPTGSITLQRTGPDGARTIQVSGTMSSTVPGAGTNPSTFAATPLVSARVTIDRITGPYSPERIVTDGVASCSAQAVTRTCSFTSRPVSPQASYRVTMTGVDQVGNEGTTDPMTIELPAETSTSPGYLDPAFGHAGIAITEVGTTGADAYDSVELANGSTVTVGARAGSPRAVVLTAHTATGQLDAGFGTGGIATTTLPPGPSPLSESYAITIDSSGRLLVASGSFNPTNLHVARFHNNGSIDSSFGTNGIGSLALASGNQFRPYSMGVDPSGRVVVVGYVDGIRFGAVRFLGNGAPDASFASGGLGKYVIGTRMEQDSGTLAIQSDGKLLIGGTSMQSLPNGALDRIPAVVRVNIDGSVDTEYGSNGWFASKIEGYTGAVRRMTIDENDALTFGFWEDGGSGLGVARLTSSGALDTTFGTGDDGSSMLPRLGSGWNGSIRSMDVVHTADGKLVVVGRADHDTNTGDEIGIGRFLADGTPDTSFGLYNGFTVTIVPAGVMRVVRAVQISNGDIIVSGTLIPTTGTRKFVHAAYLT